MLRVKLLKIRTAMTILTSIALLLAAVPESKAAFLLLQDQESDFIRFQGKVVDDITKKGLSFATLNVENSNISSITNTEGAFSIKVPKNLRGSTVIVSFLGYKSSVISIADLKGNGNIIMLKAAPTELDEVSLIVPKDASELVRHVLNNKGENYFDSPTLMKAFYRETIKKRKKNISLAEAVVHIHKAPYTSSKKDQVQLQKVRKSTDYSKLDTMALKLRGGPFNNLFIDIMKYTQYIFTPESITNYSFTYERTTMVNSKPVHIINFKPLETTVSPLYKGQLFIDPENKVLTSAIYALNIMDGKKAAHLFVKKKPKNAMVWPTAVSYRVDYNQKKGKWFFSYSNLMMTFKINWDKKLFNSIYTLNSEMAITDWDRDPSGTSLKRNERLSESTVISDEAVGFFDSNFWGKDNIIEPEKSIESAIKKIKRKLGKASLKGSTPAP
ncbi:MAG: carboxypeptidase-like regulatory domain-containing protein [Bacteroidota bacterium]